MAKKKTKKAKNKPQEELGGLPQNIVAVGERVTEDKNIYISQNVYKKIRRFAANKTENESGGMLIGDVLQEFGKMHIIISGFIEAKYTDATPTTLKFTHETWEHCHKEMAERYPGKKIVGWIHTHPNFGIFLSEYDKFIHENFFSDDHDVAYVVDPIQNTEGFYFWINGVLTKCPGFYIYEHTGKKITVEVDEDSKNVTPSSVRSPFNTQNILIAALCVVVIVMAFVIMGLGSRITKLEETTETMIYSYNQNFAVLDQKIGSLEQQIDALTPTPETSTDAGTETDGETTETETNGTEAEGETTETEEGDTAE